MITSWKLVCASLLFAIAAIAVYLLLLPSGDTLKNNAPQVVNSVHKDKPANINDPLPPLDQSFPAPAKKLYELLSEADIERETAAINKSIEKLNTELKAREAELEKAGISIPRRESVDTSSDTVLGERIAAMRKHMDDRALLESSTN